MENTISVAGIIQSLKTSDFILNCNIPLGYVAGLPIVQVKNNGSLCLVIPYLKYKITGPVDKTLVFPIKYTVTVKLPEERIVQFSDISVTAGYKTLDFSKPVGLFRHDSIKHLSKGEYRAKREELLSLYDKFLNSLAYDLGFTEEDEAKMKELLQLLIEPSLLPMYKAIDSDFYNKFLS